MDTLPQFATQPNPYEIAQYLSGFFNSTFYIITNLIVGWGTLPAIKQVLPVFIGHNIFDTIAGRYWKTEKIMFIHHLLAIALSCYIYQLETFSNDMYITVYWFSTAEISSVFNCTRWFFKKTEWQPPLDLLFAITFLIFRPLSAYKTFYLTYTSPDYMFLLPCWTIYTILNLYWCACIFLYSKRIKASCARLCARLCQRLQKKHK